MFFVDVTSIAIITALVCSLFAQSCMPEPLGGVSSDLFDAGRGSISISVSSMTCSSRCTICRAASVILLG